MRPSITFLYSGCALGCFSMLGFGLYAQYIQGFEPCPLCYFQRLVIGILGFAWMVNALYRRATILQLMIQLLLCLLGNGLAIRHAWIQIHPDVAKGTCGMGIQYMLDSYPFLEVILKSWKGTVDCTDASWRILGMTAPMWLILVFTGGICFAIFAFRQERQRIPTIT